MIKSSSQQSYSGYIYKISHPMLKAVYIGQTVKLPEQRLKEHLQEASGKRKPIKGTGALYEAIQAFGPEQFEIETLACAETKKELNDLEAYYQEKFNSVQKGLNRVKAPKSSTIAPGRIEVEIQGKLRIFSSRAELCRDQNISYTSLNYWMNKRQLSLEEAVKNAIEGAKREREKGFECYRKNYKTYTQLAQDKRVNRHNLSGREIASRVRRGMSPEEAVSTPKRSRSKISINVDDKLLNFKNVTDAYHSLSNSRKLPAYSTVIQRLEKGETPEEAFGFRERPWKKKFSDFFILEESKGYQWVGELKSWSIPVVLIHTKEIFASKRDFANAYGLEYTETSKKLKNGWSPEKILEESGHLSKE